MSLILTPTTPTALTLSGGTTRLVDLTDVAGTPSVGTAPVSNGAGIFNFTDIATQAELNAAVAAVGGGIPATIVDVKGDLIAASANDTVVRLPVGTNNQVLTADSAQTLGVKWATPATSPGVAADTIWDTKGDLAVATAADTAAKLAVGTDGQVLTADSAQTAGVKWATPSGGAAGALTLLSTTTLASPAFFDVSSISGSYNDLVLILIARETAAVTSVSLLVQLNADTGANYYREGMQVVGTGAVNGFETTGATSWAIPITGSSSPAGNFAVIELTIYGYASTTWRKNVQWHAYCQKDNTAGNLTFHRAGGLWNSTAAVTRVQMTTGATSLVVGSQLRIYGRL